MANLSTVRIRGGPRDGEILVGRNRTGPPSVVCFALQPRIDWARERAEDANPQVLMPETIILPIHRDWFSGELFVQWPEGEPEDILTRIDQTIEAWERGPDAARWVP